MKARRAGFSLIELLVALAIGAFGIAVAATVVRSTMRQSGRGNQITQLAGTARLLGRQIRTDFDLAGLGSTGAVAADCGNALWSGICGPTPGAGFSAIPVVRGANDLRAGGSITVPFVPGSDAVQVVVPDPTTVVQTLQPSPGGSGLLFIPAMPCRIVFISDHSAPNGAGRTQLLVLPPNAGANPVSSDRLQFPVYQGADVMCARVSTYWLDTSRWLRRSDLDPDVGPVSLGNSALTVNPDPSFADRVAPGVLAFQIAYRFSSEIARRTATPQNRWAYDDDPSNGLVLEADITTQGRAAWFEARQVRLTIVMRTLRSVDSQGDPIDEAAPEDMGGVISIPRGYGRYVLRTSAVLTNLRFFDQAAPSGLRAEPY